MQPSLRMTVMAPSLPVKCRGGNKKWCASKNRRASCFESITCGGGREGFDATGVPFALELYLSIAQLFYELLVLNCTAIV
jgi:hypothetical protein